MRTLLNTRKNNRIAAFVIACYVFVEKQRRYQIHFMQLFQNLIISIFVLTLNLCSTAELSFFNRYLVANVPRKTNTKIRHSLQSIKNKTVGMQNN